MAIYALVNFDEVINVLVADSIDQVPGAEYLEEVVDVSNLDYRPAPGWKYLGGVFIPNFIEEDKRFWWDGEKLNVPEDFVAPEAPAALEAPDGPSEAPAGAKSLAELAAEAAALIATVQATEED